MRESITLGRLNVLIGRNNSGKSAFLEALSLFPIPFNAYHAPFLDSSRIQLIAQLHSGLESLVYGYSGIAEIKFSINHNEIMYRITDHGNIFAFIDGKRLDSQTYLKEIAKILGVKEEERWLMKINSMVAFIPNDSNFLKSVREKIVSAWSTIMKSGANVRVVRDLISRVVHDEFTEVYLGANNVLELRKELPDDKVFWIRVTDIGDGVERLLISALYLEVLRPKLVLWDDIEASAHPGLIEVLIKWLINKNWQIVISTHSIDVLNLLTKIAPADTLIWVLRSDEYDRLNIKQLTIDDVADILESNIDIRRILDQL